MSKSIITPLLKRVTGLVQTKGIAILHTHEISRKEREVLVRTGWLTEILQGWYLLTRPDVKTGESTAWYAHFWDFVAAYLQHHYGRHYCLSAESSIDVHLNSSTIPRQVIAIASTGRGVPIKLPHDTSLFVYADQTRLPEESISLRGLQVMPLPLAVIRMGPAFFTNNPKEAEIILRMVPNASELIRVLLDQQKTKNVAGRLVGAYQFLGMETFAKELQEGLSLVGVFVKAENPFEISKPLLQGMPSQNPVAARIYALWGMYREQVIALFPEPPATIASDYLERMKSFYEQDAYHSLSIEGYVVNQALIEKVQEKGWNPDESSEDRHSRDALAARGYYEAFLEVKSSIAKILKGEPPGEILQHDLGRWFQKLFAPVVQMGLIPAADLFGYRRGQVYIRNSRHVPPAKENLRDAMDTFFECLKKESHPGVRAVLGHFIFVYIHPYMDGNGRIGRFILNAMLASGGYPWTIIHVENRTRYFAALENASVEGDIVPFTLFLKEELINPINVNSVNSIGGTESQKGKLP